MEKVSDSGVGTIFKLGGGGYRCVAIRKPLTAEIKFLLGVWSLNFENIDAKQNITFEIF